MVMTITNATAGIPNIEIIRIKNKSKIFQIFIKLEIVLIKS